MAHFDIPFQDKNSERKMLYRRIERLCRDIANRVFDQSVRVGGFMFRDGQYRYDQMDAGQWRPFGDEEYWGYREQYCWFRQTVTIPDRFRGREVVYSINPQPDCGYDSRSFQFILFVNGEIRQGMDENHTYAVLTQCAQGGETYEIALNAYCDDHDFCGQAKLHAHLRTRDNIARALYYDFSVPLLAAHQYGTDDLPRIHIIKALNEAANLLELSTADLAVFHASAQKASEYLHHNLYGVIDPVKVSAIGHTHIDTAWKWRIRQTRDKAARSFATVTALMEEYPEYKFMSPQAQLYDFIKQDYPPLYERIRALVREGRWEPEGSMWVESDTNVISGESLVRQFLVGKRFFLDEFGKQTHIMWLPDVFGYSAALPQIMKLAEIDYFMTTKISWSEMDRLPFDTFLWRGIDGTEVLSHFIPSMCERDVQNGFQTTYTADLNPDYIINGWRRYANKDLTEHWLCCYGHGDGGGGPERSMLESGRRMHKGIEGCPQTVPEFAADFFAQLADEVDENARLPKWFGELYLEFHRGTLTSQARNKRYNRKCEWLMHDCETLLSMAHALTGLAYPQEELLADWKLILLNQFHDIIPGSSIAAVYEDSRAQYEEVLASGKRMREYATDALVGAISLAADSVVVFNTLGFARTDFVETDLPTAGSFVLTDTDDNEVPYQITHDNKLFFYASSVPAKGYKVFYVRPGAPCTAEPEILTDTLCFETPQLRVAFDENCNITSLYHKKSGRETLPQGEVLNRLIAFEDRPNVYEAWDVKVYYDEKHWFIDAVDSYDVIENGPLRTILRVKRPFQNSFITQDFLFYSELDRVDVRYVIDWHEKNILLKADYPVDVNTSRATYDIQFGNLERTTHNNTTWDYAQFEVCGHKWADLSDNSFGLSVLNDCKYGWNIKNGRIRPSILRCATDPNPEQDREMHYVTYALYPHTGAVQTSAVVQHGYMLNDPLLAVHAGAHDGMLPPVFSAVSADCDNIIIETVKKAEDSDSIIVRTFETWNRTTDCTLTFDRPIRRAFVTNLLEKECEALQPDGCTIRLTYKPFQIQTLKVEF